MIRFGVKNISGEVIDGVAVKVKSFMNFGDTAVFDVPLRVTHDRANKKSGGFSINPGDTTLIDLVQKEVGSDDLYLTNGFEGDPYVPTVTHAKHLTLNVSVSAAVGPSQEREFEVSVDDKGIVSCRMIS